MYDIFNKFNIDSVESKFQLFDNNLRMAKKVALFYDEILELYKQKSINIKENVAHSELIIFESAIYTVIISLKNNKSEIHNKNFFVKDEEMFGTNIALGLQKFFYEKSLDFTDQNILYLVKSMLHYFCFMDSSELEKILFPINVEDEYKILNEEFFYLSPKNKKAYKDVLEKYILNTDFNLKDNIHKISSIIRYSNLSFNKEIMARIAIKYVENYHNDTTFIFYYFHIDEMSDVTKERAIEFKNDLIAEIKLLMKHKIEEYAISLNTEKDYDKLSKIIDDISQQHKSLDMDAINNILIKNNYYLPDLSCDIDEAKWNYCHTITKYISRFELGETFKKYANELYFKEPDNETLKDRLLSLIYYNIDDTFNFNFNEN